MAEKPCFLMRGNVIGVIHSEMCPYYEHRLREHNGETKEVDKKSNNGNDNWDNNWKSIVRCGGVRDRGFK